MKATSALLIDLHHPSGGYVRLVARRRNGWTWVGGDAYHWHPDVEVLPIYKALFEEIRESLPPQERRKLRGFHGDLPYWHIPSHLETRIRDAILAIPAHWRWGHLDEAESQPVRVAHD